MSRVRNFCFTSHIGALSFNDAKMKYMIQGDEIAPETGKQHWQGFVIFKNGRTLSAVVKEYKGIHWEVCKGTAEQNMEYCKKEGKFEEHGEAPMKPGQRADQKRIGDMVKEGYSDKEMLEENACAWVHCYKGVREARKVLYPKPKRNWEMDVRIYWGCSGAGKTRAAHDEFGESIYVKGKGKWWDGYDGEETVLIDDFDPNNCFNIEFDCYLKLLDRYPMKVEVKGGYEEFTSKRIIITSNFDPELWFAEKKNRGSFFRRVTSIKHFDGGEPGTEVLLDSNWAVVPY